jgi:hypothetical protein
MAESFSIAFEQVELVNGLAPDQAVWLFMRATLKEGGSPESVLDVREVGSFPPDANRPTAPDIQVGDAGRFAPGLQISVATRNDTHNSSTGQTFPRFALDAIAVAEGQELEIEVFMLPRVWFRQMTVDQDDFDAWARAGFLTLLGASGFGLPGLVIGAVLGGLWGTEDVDVTVPCYQTVISARHVFTLDDLRTLATEPMRRFGPNDNVAGPCGFIDSFYWLSANQHQSWSFGPSAPIERQDCTLQPWRHEPAGEWLAGTWLDREAWEKSCLGVVVSVVGSDHANVHVYDHPNAGGAPGREFLEKPILKELVPSAFTYNYFGGECPMRSAAPVCANCKRFTNLPLFYSLPKQMIAALALAPRHVGAEGWGESIIRSERKARERDCLEVERIRKAAARRGPGEARLIGPGVMYKSDGRDSATVWPVGTPPPKTLDDRPAKLRGLDVVHLHDGMSLAEIMFGCFKIPLSEREALFTYAEVPAHGAPTCARLRYMLWDDEGRVVKDIMLKPWFRPPH